MLFGFSWLEGLLLGAAVASTDAAAVFFLMHARGLRLRPRVAATLEVESGTNDPFAIFLTIVLVEILLLGPKPWNEIVLVLAREAVLGTIIGMVGGLAIASMLNRVELPQGLHAPFVVTGGRSWFSGWRRPFMHRDFSRSIWPVSLSAIAPRAGTAPS